MGTLEYDWQKKDDVLRLFGETERQGRSRYASFIAIGVIEGRRPELVGGGLLRSIGGWSALKVQRFRDIRIKGDERILGSGDFVERVLRGAEEELEQRTLLKRQGFDLEALLRSVADYYKVDMDSLKTGIKERSIVKARSVLCYLAVRKLKMSATEVAIKLNITPSTVSKAIIRGKCILRQAGVEETLIKC